MIMRSTEVVNKGTEEILGRIEVANKSTAVMRSIEVGNWILR